MIAHMRANGSPRCAEIARRDLDREARGEGVTAAGMPLSAHLSGRVALAVADHARTLRAMITLANA
jgi:hypothetical protein